MKKSTEFRSFAFTIRPLEGVPENGQLEKSVIDYVAKYKGFVAAEMEDTSRHLHGQIFFEKSKRKHDFNNKLSEFCHKGIQDWTPHQDHVLRSGTEVAYDDNWYLEYCNKPDTQVLLHAMPEKSIDYYPSKEEQASVMARAHAVDKTFHHLKELYDNDPVVVHNVKLGSPSQSHIREWLYEQMFVKKTIRVIEDKRKFNQRAEALYHYLPNEISKYDKF